MNQQDIVNVINSSLVDYNVRWNDIKYMADKAILKINSYLGAKYPPMSEVLQSPNHTYTVRINNKDLPIFPEVYIHTIVIPFIQSEVLAQDEEFTTIYNKYVMDYDNGLFEMMSNEYNRIPKPFRQPIDSGVFFTNDNYAQGFGMCRPQDKHRHRHEHEDIPVFECKINYHIANPNIYMSTQFTTDIIKYPYGAEVKILDCVSNPQFKGVDGYEKSFFNIHTENTVYKFKGWSYNERTKELAFTEGEEWSTITVKGDVNLYAVWEEESIFNNTGGVITVKDPHIAAMVHHLVLPENISGYPVLEIGADFDKDMVNLETVQLPKTLMTIKEYAFTQPSIVNIIFPEYNYLFNAPNIILESNAISIEGLTKLKALYIPYSVRNIGYRGVNLGANYVPVMCEHETRPVSWDVNWCTVDSNTIAWGVANG